MEEIRKMVVFAILMENNNGIVGKAPSYIDEKLGMCQKLEKPWRLLDSSNLLKYREWQKQWGFEDDSLE